jgi:hypothetical protein
MAGWWWELERAKHFDGVERINYQEDMKSQTGRVISANFDTYTNIKAQLEVGRGSTAAQFDYNFIDWSIYNTAGGDAGIVAWK